MHLHDHLDLRKRTHTDTHETTGSKTAYDNERRSEMTWVVYVCERVYTTVRRPNWEEKKKDENAWRDERHSFKTELTRTHKIKNGENICCQTWSGMWGWRKISNWRSMCPSTQREFTKIRHPHHRQTRLPRILPSWRHQPSWGVRDHGRQPDKHETKKNFIKTLTIDKEVAIHYPYLRRFGSARSRTTGFLARAFRATTSSFDLRVASVTGRSGRSLFGFFGGFLQFVQDNKISNGVTLNNNNLNLLRLSRLQV